MTTTTPAVPVAAAGASACPLCTSDGGVVLLKHSKLRVIRAEVSGFPVYYRVIWNAHVAELSELTAADRALCMNAVVAVEQVLRAQAAPTKINLAALGNMVPHLHWHVIARYDWDTHFPEAVWAEAVREPSADRLMQLAAQLPALDQAVTEAVHAVLD
jgi:diadenosine tetraphosphate (Ap4A) HIT family hydrolase